MTIAQEIKEQVSDFEKVLEVADKKAVDAYQDWENKETTFKFSDGSHLKVRYPEIKVL